MKPYLETLRRRIDALSLRERALLFLSLAALLVAGWHLLAFEPLAQRGEQKRLQVAALQSEISELEGSAEAIRRRADADPDEEARALRQRLTAELQRVEAQIGQSVRGLIPPAEMARVLEEVLVRSTELRLVRIESLPAQPLLSGPEGADIHRHALRLEFTGSYLQTLAYLHALQALPDALFWDSLTIRAGEAYPQAQVILVVHTLGLGRRWIGV